MQVNSYKTHKITLGDDLYQILDKYLPKLEEKSVVVITSKIVSICQGDVVKNDGKISKEDLMKKEADYYLGEKHKLSHGYHITIKNNILIASAGIDESNGNDYFILWPKNPQATTNAIWKYLRQKNKIKHLGIIVSDSNLPPLRWGTRGVGITWCGFKPLKNYIGKPDLFNRHLFVTKASILDGLTASAVLIMGEGSEQTPLAVINDVPFVEFQDQPPTKDELNEMTLTIKEDVYKPILSSVEWIKGDAKKNR